MPLSDAAAREIANVRDQNDLKHVDAAQPALNFGNEALGPAEPRGCLDLGKLRSPSGGC